MKRQNLELVPVRDIPLGNLVSTDSLTDVYNVCIQLKELCKRENGVGISAVQAGVPWDLFLVRFPDGQFGYFLNCEYNPLNDVKIIHLEGCLSLKDAKGRLRNFVVERFKNLSVKGKKLVLEGSDLKIMDFEEEYEGFYAAVFQHEIDHSRQITIDQIGKEVDLTLLG